MKRKSLTVLILSSNKTSYEHNIKMFDALEDVDEIIILSEDDRRISSKQNTIKGTSLNETKTIELIKDKLQTEYLLCIVKDNSVTIDIFSLKRLMNLADNNNSGLIYSDFNEMRDDTLFYHSLIDYQLGSIRDDFDFGSLFLLNRDVFIKCFSEYQQYEVAGLYALQLAISRVSSIIKIPEPIYTIIENKSQNSGENQFNYVDPHNKDLQLEMENAATYHLKKINAYLPPRNKTVSFDDQNFEIKTSVIIPVKNRSNTIKDAIESAFKQKTDFNFNIIVVDNHSTDGTTETVKQISVGNKKVVHIVPRRNDLNIGGCWNEAINNPNCGMFAVQLDSDDLYSDEDSLQRIIDKFYETNCAMVIGSYKLTDFNLNEIPPGVINHSEWTDKNGHNNALRVNGLGAPRAFFTPIVRRISFPNVSYGEDYAVALAISRKYKIGRIFDPIYLCRRWEGNTDSDLTLEQQNKNDFYKDFIRTQEIIARQKINSQL